MDLVTIAFYAFALIVIGSAAVVVFSKNIMYSAFSLLFTFFGVAGLFVLLNADFVGITQIMIYIGGILVLIIFGVMVTTKVTGVDIKSGVSGKLQMGLAGLLSAVVLTLMLIMYMNVQWFTKSSPKIETTVKELGTILMTKYILAFEVTAVLLLIAFLGAALIARRKN